MVCQKWVAIQLLSFCLCFIHLNISEASSLQNIIDEENQETQILTNAHAPYNDITRRMLKGGAGGGGGHGGSSSGGRSFSGFFFAGGSHKSNGSSVRASSILHVIVRLTCAIFAFAILASLI